MTSKGFSNAVPKIRARSKSLILETRVLKIGHERLGLRLAVPKD